jgi:peptide/nickel transport system substrate-binding protein
MIHERTNIRAPRNFFLGLILTLAACFATGAGAQGAAGTLYVGLRSDAESLDPHLVYHPSGFAVMEALYDSLVMADWDGAIVPHLAASWSFPDTSTIEFVLRDDVTFHNGEKFDAQSVKYSVERILDEELQSGLRSRFTVIESVEVLSPLRVRLHLARADSSILWNLTGLAMLPPGYGERVTAAAFSRAPVGTGPFSFVEWVRDDHITLAANPNYFEGGVKGQPGVAQVVFRILPEDATRTAELRAGGVQLIEKLPVDLVPTIEAAGMTAVPADTGRFSVAWIVSDEGGPLADKRVRQALNYALNTDAIITSVYKGYASPIASPFTPSTLGYDPSIKPYPYDPGRARELLAEAGYPDGFAVTLDTTGDPTEGLLTAAALEEIGIQVTVRQLEASIFNANWTTGQTGEIYAASWGAAGDPQQYLDMLVKSDGFLSRYSDTRVDELLAESAVTLDTDARAVLLSELQQILHDDPAAIYQWSTADIYGVAPSVQNWRPHSTERLIVSGVSLK